MSKYLFILCLLLTALSNPVEADDFYKNQDRKREEDNRYNQRQDEVQRLNREYNKNLDLRNEINKEDERQEERRKDRRNQPQETLSELSPQGTITDQMLVEYNKVYEIAVKATKELKEKEAQIKRLKQLSDDVLDSSKKMALLLPDLVKAHKDCAETVRRLADGKRGQ